MKFNRISCHTPLMTANMSDSEPSFGLPKDWDKIPEEERKLLQKPLIFPNHEKLFRRFTVGATLGEHVLVF